MRRPRSLLLALLVAITATTAGYAVYWHRLASGIEEGIARWADERRAEGWAVAYGTPRTGGFPGAIEVSVDEPLVAAPDGLRWETGRIVAHVPPHDPGNVTLVFTGAHRLASPDLPGPLALSPDAATGRLRLDAGGRPRAAELRLTGVEAAAPGVAGRAATVIATLEEADIDSPAFLTLWVHDLEWQAPLHAAAALPARVESLRLRLRVDPVPTLEAAPARAATAWRDGGGVVEVQELSLVWQPLTVHAEGRLSLDERLQPAMILDAAITGLDEVVRRLSEAGRLDDGQARTAQTVLTLLARPREDGRPVLQAPVALRDGRLFLGPVAVARVPHLDWQK